MNHIELMTPVTPGELLFEEFLQPLALSHDRLAEAINVPVQGIEELVAGKGAVTTETDTKLCHFFGLSNGYWLRAQAAYDAEMVARGDKVLLDNDQCWSNKSMPDDLLPLMPPSVSHVAELRC